MNKFDLYKQMYYYELDTKEKLNSRINAPMTSTSLLFAAAVYFWGKTTKLPIGYLTYVYWIMLAIFTITLIVITILVCKVYYGYEYGYVSAEMFKDAENNLTEYYNQNYDTYYKNVCFIKSKEELLNKDLEEQIIERYIEAIELNKSQNDKKVTRMSKIGRYTLWSIFCIAVCFFILYYQAI